MTVAEPVCEPKHFKTRFTPENARTMSAKGLAARRAIEDERKRKAELPPELPTGEKDPWQSEQLARVRGHIVAVNKRIDQAVRDGDEQALERLVRARSGLDEIERRAAERSLPPVRRVAEVKAGGRSSLLSGLPDLPT